MGLINIDCRVMREVLKPKLDYRTWGWTFKFIKTTGSEYMEELARAMEVEILWG